MPAITVDVYQRKAGQHRTGHYALMVDGQEAFYTCDPSQFMPWALRTLAEQGKTGPEAAIEALAMAEQRAHYAIARIAERLARGSYAPAGMPINPTGSMEGAARAVQHETRQARKARTAAEAFLSRGRLKRPVMDPNTGTLVGYRQLTAEEREKLVYDRDQQTDHVSEWRQRRRVLFNNAMLRAVEIEKSIERLDRNRPDFPEKLAKLEAEFRRALAERDALRSDVQNASHGFQYAYGQYLTAGVNLASDDIRLVPLMSNTTVDTERDAKDQVSDFTTLDEADGSGYTTGGLALDTQAVNIDDANDRAEFDCDNETISAFGACTRSIIGNLLIKFVTNLNASVPLHWIEYSTAKTPDGSDFTIQINAEGLLQAVDG